MARLRAGSSSRSTLGLINRLAREDRPLTETRRSPNRAEGQSSRARADFPFSAAMPPILAAVVIQYAPSANQSLPA